jgi:hypothetical protein
MDLRDNPTMIGTPQAGSTFGGQSATVLDGLFDDVEAGLVGERVGSR